MKANAILMTNLFFCAGCASVNSRMPQPATLDVAQETQSQSDEALIRYQEQSRRLAQVSHRILEANAELCKNTRLDPGLVLHSKKSYAKDMRAVAEKHCSLAMRRLFCGDENRAIGNLTD